MPASNSLKQFLAFIPALLLLACAFSVRKRASQIAILAESEEDASSDYLLWSLPGVVLKPGAQSSAAAFAREQGTDVLDLLPSEVDGDAFVDLMSRIKQSRDPKRLDGWNVAGQAMLVRRELIERSGLERPSEPAEMRRAAKILRRYGAEFGTVVVPGLELVREDVSLRGRLKKQAFQVFAPLAVLGELVALLIPLLPFRRSWRLGLLTLLAFNLQPVIGALGTPFRIRNSGATLLLRHVSEMWSWLASLLTMKPASPGFDDASVARYAADIADGVERFLEPRREDCPLCGSPEIELYLRSHDAVVQKPGEFKLDRCGHCGHIFQNPRLTIEGLDYYYRDVYDGINFDTAQTLFEYEEDIYRLRAKRLIGYSEPRRWLDVGTGFGHLPFFAKEIWPETQFDGLDIGDGINEAKRRGWVTEAHQGMFPELAPRILASYDVVSMCHYIEHTREPREELKAAHDVLRPGGHLLIEIPNPECPAARLLGRYWFGWLQPQHQHFLNQQNLERLLNEAGFEAVQWHWGECHLNGTFLLAALLFVQKLAPGTRYPWLPEPGFWRRMATRAAWTLSPLLLVPAAILDTASGGFFKRPHNSFNYGVLARLKDEAAP